MNLERFVSRHAIARTTAAMALGLVLLGVVSAAAEASECLPRDVIRCGGHSETERAGSLLDWIIFKMKQSQDSHTPLRAETANRQAKLFAMFLYDENPAAFAAMTRAISEGQPFGEAVKIGYRTGLDGLWQRFVQANGK